MQPFCVGGWGAWYSGDGGVWGWVCECVNEVYMEVTECGDGCVGVGVEVCLRLCVGGWVSFGEVA